MEERNPKLSRREFLKLAVLGGFKAAGVVVGSSLVVGGTYKLLEVLDIIPEKPVNQTDWFQREMNILESSRKVASRQSRKISSNSSENTSSADLEQENGIIFGNIDFADPEHAISMLFRSTTGEEIEVPDFFSWPKDRGLDEKKIFELGNDTALAGLDNMSRIVLWIHSGQKTFAIPGPNGFTMSGLQKYFEQQETESMLTIWETDRFLRDVVRGSEMIIRQNGVSTNSKVVAAVRIPPDMIDEHSANMDRLPEWVSEKFKDTGFENLTQRSDVLMPKFCGRALVGEKPITGKDPFVQTRFILGIVPA